MVKNKDEDDLKAKDAAQRDRMKDAQFKGCHMGLKDDDPNVKDQSWFIGDDNALQYAVVWLKPPDGYYYKLPKDDLDAGKGAWEKAKLLHQPYCAFQPHVMVLFQYYKDDTGKDKETGQELTVRNDASLEHNTKIEESFNSSLKAGNSDKVPSSKVTPRSKPYQVNCSIHSWMGGYIWSFDHPYAAVTDKDGKFEIKNAPAGVEVELMVWHEKGGMVKKNEKITLDKEKAKDLGTIEVEYKK